jgi:hypothetical protein
MMEDPIFETDLLTCEIDTTIPVLVHRWLRPPVGDEFKNGLLKVLEEYKKIKPFYDDLKWLADTELLGQLDYQIEDWLEKDWDRLLFDDAGVKVHAVILGDDILADYSMEKFKLSADDKFKEKGVKLNVFLDKESALNWLREN